MILGRHIYIPEDYFDFGVADEHPVTFTYSVSVEYEGGSKRKSITIWSVIGQIKDKDENGVTISIQPLDITNRINSSPAKRTYWEDVLFKDYISRAECCEDAGA